MLDQNKSANTGGTRSTYTIVELSIVLVVIGILFALILPAAITLYENAEVANLQADLERLKADLILTRDNLGCLPGECDAQIIAPFFSSGGTNISNSHDHTETPGCIPASESTGKIDSAVKRTCAFYTAQGLENSFKSLNLTIVDGNLDGSIAGINIPISSYSKAAIDLRAIPPAVNGTGTNGHNNKTVYPLEAGNGSAIKAAGYNALIIRDVVLIPSASVKHDDITSGMTNRGTLSPRLAKKLDNKIDDGSPYTGNLICGQNANGYTSANSNRYCTNVVITPQTLNADGSVTATAAYLNSNDTNDKSCVCAYILTDLSS